MSYERINRELSDVELGEAELSKVSSAGKKNDHFANFGDIKGEFDRKKPPGLAFVLRAPAQAKRRVFGSCVLR